MTVATLNMSSRAPIGEAMTFPGAMVLTGVALRSIISERVKQVDRHGRTIERDLETNAPHDLPLAAASYLNAAIDQLTGEINVSEADPATWPWDPEHWKPEDARTNLVKAAALIWAAIDRLDHAPGAELEREMAA